MLSLAGDFSWEAPEEAGTFFAVTARVGNEASAKPAEWLAADDDADFRVYLPLQDDSGLFLNFAVLGPLAAEIVSFADRHGFLTGERQRFKWREVIFNSSADDEWPAVQRSGGMARQGLSADGELNELDAEPFALWRKEIAWMRATVDLWNAAKAGDAALLAQMIEKPTVKSGARFRPAEAAAEATAVEVEDSVDLQHGVHTGDLRIVALAVLHERVRAKLESLRVGLTVRWNWKNDKSRLDVTTPSLLAAMTVQLASAIGFNKEYRSCRECGKWFELLSGMNRDSRLTCSGSCRRRSWRHRKMAARAMCREGKSAKEIAKELGTTVAMVKKWIQEG